MLLGTVYVSLSSWTLFYDCFGLAQKLQDVQRSLQRIFSSSANSSQTGGEWTCASDIDGLLSTVNETTSLSPNLKLHDFSGVQKK